MIAHTQTGYRYSSAQWLEKKLNLYVHMLDLASQTSRTDNKTSGKFKQTKSWPILLKLHKRFRPKLLLLLSCWHLLQSPTYTPSVSCAHGQRLSHELLKHFIHSELRNDPESQSARDLPQCLQNPRDSFCALITLWSNFIPVLFHMKSKSCQSSATLFEQTIL